MKSNAYPQLYRLCEQRYSCRAYSDRKVERDTVLTVLDIVRLAPVGLQPSAVEVPCG